MVKFRSRLSRLKKKHSTKMSVVKKKRNGSTDGFDNCYYIASLNSIDVDMLLITVNSRCVFFSSKKKRIIYKPMKNQFKMQTNVKSFVSFFDKNLIF